MTPNKTALVIGATGMVGSELVKLLLQDSRFNKVVLFARRSSQINNEKLTEHLIDFDRHETWEHLVTGDVLFSALGTTISKAGSKPKQYTIDFTYQYHFAKAAAKNGVKVYILISSAGASADSNIFYSRMKGELEDAIKKLPFSFIHIIRPGLLTGDRNEFRLGERLAAPILSLLQYIKPLRKYRPIHANIVARAMVNAAFIEKEKLNIHTLGQVFELSERRAG